MRVITLPCPAPSSLLSLPFLTLSLSPPPSLPTEHDRGLSYFRQLAIRYTCLADTYATTPILGIQYSTVYS